MSLLLFQQTSAAGVGPGATAADNVIASMALPANAFDKAGRGIIIVAAGSFAANGNNKTLKLIVNPASAVVGSTVGASGTTIISTAVITTNGGGWHLTGHVFKYGLPGSNTQIGQGSSIVGPASQASGAVQVTAPALITATESGVIWLALTANCATATTDVLMNLFNVIGTD